MWLDVNHCDVKQYEGINYFFAYCQHGSLHMMYAESNHFSIKVQDVIYFSWIWNCCLLGNVCMLCVKADQCIVNVRLSLPWAMSIGKQKPWHVDPGYCNVKQSEDVNHFSCVFVCCQHKKLRTYVCRSTIKVSNNVTTSFFSLREFWTWTSVCTTRADIDHRCVKQNEDVPYFISLLFAILQKHCKPHPESDFKQSITKKFFTFDPQHGRIQQKVSALVKHCNIQADDHGNASAPISPQFVLAAAE